MNGNKLLDHIYDHLNNTDEPRGKPMRAPSFNPEETKALINCLKDERIVFDHSSNAETKHLKLLAWKRITNRYNRTGLMKRPMKNLQVKFDNMKKRLKIRSKLSLYDYLFSENLQVDDVYLNLSGNNSVLLDMNEHFKEKNSKENRFEEVTFEEIETLDDDEVMNEETVEIANNDGSMNDESDNEYTAIPVKRERSSKFSDEECKVLLDCMKNEKIIFSNESNQRAIRLKDLAWRRITNRYNSSGLMKRPMRNLQTKFFNMKKRMKKQYEDTSLYEFLYNEREDSGKVEDIVNDDSKPIWLEDVQELNNQFQDESIRNNDNVNRCLEKVLLNTNIDSLNNPTEDAELLKSKKNLIKWQLENARLENMRLKEQIKSENIERSLRLRAARLAVVVAEENLGKDHPALRYTKEESEAHRYMKSVE